MASRLWLEHAQLVDGNATKVGDRNTRMNCRCKFRCFLEENGACFEVVSETECRLYVQRRAEPRMFTFDNIFGEQSSQNEIFSAVGIPTVEHLLAGLNSTILTYGPSGTGKTHTMLGDPDSDEMQGLAPRMFQRLFARIEEERATMTPAPEYKFVCSSVEIYNETITDLLAPASKNLPLRIGTPVGTYVENLREVEVKNGNLPC